MLRDEGLWTLRTVTTQIRCVGPCASHVNCPHSQRTPTDARPAAPQKTWLQRYYDRNALHRMQRMWWKMWLLEYLQQIIIGTITTEGGNASVLPIGGAICVPRECKAVIRNTPLCHCCCAVQVGVFSHQFPLRMPPLRLVDCCVHVPRVLDPSGSVWGWMRGPQRVKAWSTSPRGSFDGQVAVSREASSERVGTASQVSCGFLRYHTTSETL